MKVLLDEAGRVARVSKELAPDSCAGEFTGVALARGPAVACLRDTMAAMLADPAAVSGAWYDLALDQMARAGEALGCVSLPADTYWEVDTLEDLARARAALK
jgi:choline kinase